MKKIKKVVAISFVFLLSILATQASALTIERGDYYYIASALDTNQVLDVSNGSQKDGANIQLYQKNGTDAQLFKFESSEDGYVLIINKGSGKVLDVEGGLTESETNVQLWTQNNTQAQQWKFYYAYGSDENVSIMARCGKFLDVSGGNTENGTNIWIYDGNNTKAQAFKLIPYINTTYQTVTLNFDDIDSWKQEMETAQRNVTFGGHYGVNPSGNGYYDGKIITGVQVLEWKSIDVKAHLIGPGEYYRTETIKLPKKIQYKLHTHNNQVKMWFTVSNLNFWQQCECGYRDEWKWEVPLPDFMLKSSDAQTTQKVIDAISPKHFVICNVPQ